MDLAAMFFLLFSGVARGPLQGRPLQFSDGMGSWRGINQELTNFEQLCVQNLALAISCCFSHSKSAHKIRLARNWPSVEHGLLQPLTRTFPCWNYNKPKVFLPKLLWQHPIFVGNVPRKILQEKFLANPLQQEHPSKEMISCLDGPIGANLFRVPELNPAFENRVLGH